MDVTTLLEGVSDQVSFLAFARQLQADRARSAERELSEASSALTPDAGGWENTTIEAFLQAAISWAEDSKFGASQGLSTNNPWRQFATFLYCGKIYE
jgi:hypothetical protein